MTWLDTLTMTAAALSAIECVAGRLAALDWRRHRHGLLLGYFAAAGVCILAASMLWQQMDVRWLDWAAWGVAAHLAFSWRDWRHGAPEGALQGAAGHAGGMVPSRLDGER